MHFYNVKLKYLAFETSVIQPTIHYYSWQEGNLLLQCHIQPKAAGDEIVGVHGDRLKVRITAPPIDGKANQHIISWFSKLFKVPKSDISILQGDLGRQKTLLIRKPKSLPDHIAHP